MKKLVFILFILAGMFVYSQPQKNWSVFRGDQQLQGVSASKIPSHPKLIWSFDTGDMIKSAPVAASGKIVVGSTSGVVFCLDIQGRKVWEYETENSIEAPALILGNTAYIGNLDGQLLAIDLNSGKLKWEYQCENQISGSPNYWSEGGKTSIVVGSYDFYLHCVDAETGEVRWKYETDNFVNGAAACYNGQAVFGGCDGFLHFVDIATGKLMTKIDVATYVASSVTVAGNKVYLGDYDGIFSEVDIASGKVSWFWEDPGTRLPFIASPAVKGDKVVIGNNDKHIYCFDRNTGNLKWKHNTGRKVDASCVISGSNVLAANTRGDLLILNLSDGKPVWSYELGSAVVNNPAVFSNKIVVGAYDGFVYCFGE